MKRYTIEKYKEFQTVKIYTVKFEDEKLNEIDHFISKFIDDDKFKEDFNIIIYWINKIGETGALERYFRPEKKALAIPLESGYYLRLYCYRLNDHTIILGNGGIKSSKKVQDSPDCYPHFKLMNHVAKKIYWGIKDEKIQLDNGRLKGKLNFKYQL